MLAVLTFTVLAVGALGLSRSSVAQPNKNNIAIVESPQKFNCTNLMEEMSTLRSLLDETQRNIHNQIIDYLHLDIRFQYLLADLLIPSILFKRTFLNNIGRSIPFSWALAFNIC